MKNFYLYILTMLIVISFNSCQDNSAKKERIVQQLSEANALYEKGEYKTAMNMFDSLIEKDSLIGEFYYKRGYCKLQIFDPETSKEDFKKAIKLNYRAKDAYLNLGVIECFYNDSLAIKYFDIVLNMDSTDAKVRLFRKEAVERLRISSKTIEL